ncbi:MAG TPA: hypothetical protein VGL82_12035 [Bryobacteraceae bacterium]|jgi:hypothetical protein
MLDSKKAAQQPEDRKASETMNAYFGSFIRNPNSAGIAPGRDFTKTHQVMHLDSESHATPEEFRTRHVFLDSPSSGH